MIRTFRPIDALRKLVDYIWVVDFDFLAEDNRDDLIMPLGHVNVIFNYGSAYRLMEQEQITVIPDSVIIGQIKSAKYVQYGSHLTQIGIALTPLGLLQLFQYPGIQLTEQMVPAACVDAGLDKLYRILIGSTDIDDTLYAINHYLLYKLEELDEKDTSRIEEMLAYVEQECEQLSIVRMAHHFRVSVSTLERGFKKDVGLTPKSYGNIVKFRKHVEMKGRRNWLEHRYYDQSHLLKAAHKFAGKTIKQLEKQLPELTLDYLWHGPQ
ncbi:hypothetical protein J40TS1_33430 [Paenibacillus montaniterrae]|uniref:HTH araC/xylS-type domain-containing protein n=1 Tax=Paenibacillus montaniterrae TaxID=429341 RepID=A0A919YSQ2_9BACL|nr:DUF6597 domain-containing transcriptional factor [Paenibacillus montaniterrae]GIP17701.1 hypothetical protein J40TS1_33430 [Paenibacillus montaniterrae]